LITVQYLINILNFSKELSTPTESIRDPAFHGPVRNMSFLIHPAIPPVRIKRIILATGCRCELCGKEILAADLEVHTIGPAGDRTGESTADLERELLVLCPRCHHDVHEEGVGDEDQRALLAFRRPEVTEEIRKILSTKPKPYVPPEVDLEEAFSSATRLDTQYRGM
jgi:hypothetical protein